VNADLPSSLLVELSQRIETWMGLFFPPDRWADLMRKLDAAAPAFGCSDAEACARLLTASVISKKQIELLATYLAVGETYFFREPRSFEVLEQEILPPLIQERRNGARQLRFWSAACCTGEEPYSIAMLLHRLLPDLSAWKIDILATDISSRFLRKAAEGVYGQWSFRGISPAVQAQHFRRTPNGRYAISSALKKMVSFTQLNLVEDVYPSSTNNTTGIDVIFCRNVLIYFTTQRIRRILTQLQQALNEGGWLIVSPVETAFVLDSPFTAMQFPGVTLFRKGSSQTKSHFLVDPVFMFPPAPSTVDELPWFSPMDPRTNTIGVLSTPIGVEPQQEEWEQDTPPPSPLPGEDWRRLYEEACTFYARGQYAAVVTTLRTIRWKERSEDLFSSPTREQIMTLLARSHANQGQLTEAQAWCEQALAVNKFDPGLYYLHATILLECGQETEARSSLTQALYLDHRFVLAHFTLGNLARQRKEFKEAEKRFEKALTLLQRYRSEDILPESEGMTAGRLAQIIGDMSKRG
jgi:chemotaxis protein methyltransferase CheR